MHRDAHPAAFVLSLMQEAQAGREERDHGSGAAHLGRERRRGARLAVVFEEAREVILELEPGAQVLAHRSEPAARALIRGRTFARTLH